MILNLFWSFTFSSLPKLCYLRSWDLTIILCFAMWTGFFYVLGYLVDHRIYIFTSTGFKERAQIWFLTLSRLQERLNQLESKRLTTSRCCSPWRRSRHRLLKESRPLLLSRLDQTLDLVVLVLFILGDNCQFGMDGIGLDGMVIIYNRPPGILLSDLGWET